MTESTAGGSHKLTLLEILKKSTEYLAARGVDQPRLAAELLAAQALECRRLELYLRFDRVPAEPEVARIRAGLTRLGSGEPVQYVLGTADFMREHLVIDRRVLIPRPETEQLVEKVLETTELGALSSPAIADVGTGSGCIALALARAWPAARIWAVDRSPEAIEVASDNIRRAGAVGVLPTVGDLLSSFQPDTFDAVIGNLPYIPSAECETLPRNVRDFEPRSALDGGADGLDLIRRLVEEARGVLRPGGWLFLEIGTGQGEAVRGILSGYEAVEIFQDYAGHERMVRARRGGKPA
jgi:release factor glutamine methyltransferase